MSLLNAGDIIDRSGQFYRLHPAKILRIVVWNLAVGVLAAAVETVAYWFSPGGSPIASAATGAASLLALVVNVLAMIMLVRLAANEITGVTQAPLGFRAARRVFWPTLGVTLASGILIFLGAVAFVVPGLVFWTWFAFAPIAVALGVAPWKRAFAASRELSAGRFLAVFWRLIAPLLFFSLLEMVLILVAILLLQGTIRGIWSIELAADGAPLWFLLVANSTAELVRDLISPLFVFAVTILYFALKEQVTSSVESGKSDS
jgi:hypothetical protein